MNIEEAVAIAPKRKIVAPTIALIVAVVVIGGLGGWLYVRSTSAVNKIALTATAKPVTVVAAVATTYQPTRRYVGTVEPWVEAKVGPQMVAAYVDTVLVRPGDIVKRGQVIATLDCRNASAVNKAIAMQARAAAAMHTAAANESTRVSSLLDGGFVSANEADLKNADSTSKEAQTLALQAQAVGSSLQVDDCILRAPFDGEIGDRHIDPGAFVRPGMSIATVVDRRTVRIAADVPEDDFAHVPPGANVHLHFLATGADLDATISRRAPAADQGTRTAHIELDIADADHSLPVWTTAELQLEVGAPVPATTMPLTAANVRGSKVSVFVVKDGVAHATTGKLLGEHNGELFVDDKVAPGSQVVTQGRGELDDKDHVTAKLEPWTPSKPR